MRKRILHIAILAGDLTAGSELWLLATPGIDPPRTAGAWTLSGKAGCVNFVPGEIRGWRGTSGARRVCRAEYAGSPTMRLTLVEMPGSPGRTAFDAWQEMAARAAGQNRILQGQILRGSRITGGGPGDVGPFHCRGRKEPAGAK